MGKPLIYIHTNQQMPYPSQERENEQAAWGRRSPIPSTIGWRRARGDGQDQASCRVVPKHSGSAFQEPSLLLVPG